MAKEKEQEPSWGMAGFSRCTHTPEMFFGSDVPHMSSVSLRIHTGYISDGSDYHDYYMGDELLIEVTLTEMQFATMLTTMNHGTGVPCTVNCFRDGKLVQIPNSPRKLSKRERFDKTLKNKSDELVSTFLSDIQGTIDSGTMGVKIKETLRKEVEQIRMEITRNLPYLMECYKESMDETESDAKASVEGFVNTVVHQTGLKALQQMTLEQKPLPKRIGVVKK